MSPTFARQRSLRVASAASVAFAGGRSPMPTISRQSYPVPTIAPCACGGGCPRCKTKRDQDRTLAIGQPSDSHEKEAETMAARVTSTETPAASRALLQLKNQKSNFEIQSAPAVSPSVNDVLRSPGHPLDPATRAFMERRFGHDFGRVRVHSDARAAEAADALNAVAYTGNGDIAFGPGQYEPASTEGRRLLAHELTHVVQQRAGVRLKDGVGQAGDAYERQADAVADLVVNGRPAAPLLRIAGSSENHGARRTEFGSGKDPNPAIQMQLKPKPMTPHLLDIPGMEGMMAKFAALNAIKEPMMRAIAKKYLKGPGGIDFRRVVYDTPYGGDKVIGTAPPTEERVFWALMSAADLKKIGKGDKPTDWAFDLADQPAAMSTKTDSEKGKEMGMFGTEFAISKWIDKKYAVKGATEAIEKPYITKQLIRSAYQKSVANLGVGVGKYVFTGEAPSPSSVVEAISEPVARWVMKDVLLVSAEVVTKTIPVIGWLWLAYDVVDLLISLDKPVEKELSPYQMESANIVASVRAYLQGKKEVAALKPYDPYKDLKPLKNDATIVAPRY